MNYKEFKGLSHVLRRRRKALGLCIQRLSAMTGISVHVLRGSEKGTAMRIDDFATVVQVLGGDVRLTWSPLNVAEWQRDYVRLSEPEDRRLATPSPEMKPYLP